MKQREAVFQATVQSFAEQGIEFVAGDTIVHDHVTPAIRKTIVDRVVSLFQENQVDLKDTPSNQKKLQDPAELRRYVAGLVTNWHNKDPQLNAGAKYEPKSPGSRQSSTDSSIKEMKQLLKYLESQGDELGAERVKQAIAVRQSELASSKTPALPDIDFSVIPDDIKDLINL